MNCPLCDAKNTGFVFQVKDDSISQTSFGVMQCESCACRFTENPPNQNEIGQYYESEVYISHSDTQKGLINRLYHLVRKRSLIRKRKLVELHTKENVIQEVSKASPQSTILDIGCGTGAFLNEMQKNGWQTIGLEPDEKARKIANEKYQVVAAHPEKLFTLTSDAVDAVSMWHVLEHVHEVHRYLAKIRELLKENGILIIAVPNYTSFDATYYQEKWAAYDVPRHLYHFSPQSMQRLLQEHGFEILSYQKMPFDSFYVSMLSEKYRNNDKLSIGGLIKAVWIGSKSNLKSLGNPQKCSSVIYVAGLS